jgi:hypothetical protein
LPEAESTGNKKAITDTLQFTVILSSSLLKMICGNTPDIKVDNFPYESYKGKDAQLDAAVQYLIKLDKEQPVVIPPITKYPVKAFDYEIHRENTTSIRCYFVVKHDAGRFAPLNRFGTAVLVHAKRTATGIFTFFD